MALGPPCALQWVALQTASWTSRPHSTWSVSPRQRAAAFLQSLQSVQGYKQTKKPIAIRSMRTHLLWCHLCTMGSWAKEGWQSWACIEDPEWKLFNTLLGLKLSKRRSQEDGNLTLWWKIDMLEMDERSSKQTLRMQMPKRTNPSKETFQLLGEKGKQHS